MDSTKIVGVSSFCNNFWYVRMLGLNLLEKAFPPLCCQAHNESATASALFGIFCDFSGGRFRYSWFRFQNNFLVSLLDRQRESPTFSCQIYKEMIKHHSFPAVQIIQSKHYFFRKNKTNVVLIFCPKINSSRRRV